MIKRKWILFIVLLCVSIGLLSPCGGGETTSGSNDLNDNGGQEPSSNDEENNQESGEGMVLKFGPCCRLRRYSN